MYQSREKFCFSLAGVLLLLLLGLSVSCAFAQQPVVQVLHSFTPTNGQYINGSNPQAGLVPGPDGAFYGTTYAGGSSNGGTIFRITTNGVFATLASFDVTKGSNPQASLTMGNDGNFYGTTHFGGTNGGYGTVFQVTTNGVLTAIASFANTNGAYPIAPLALAQDGSFYGTTLGGGTGAGTVFHVTSDGDLTELVSFPAFLPGPAGQPYGGIVFGIDGGLCGTVAYGGAFNLGIIFEVTTNGSPVNWGDQFRGTNGSHPEATLVLGNDGAFYGTTSAGGTNGGYGTVFRVATNGGFDQTLVTLASFNSTNGANPSSLALCSDSAFYGVTTGGGTNGYGTVFMVTTNGALAALVSFANTNGANPVGGLTLGNDGDFYGTTSQGGGSNSIGTIFALRYPPVITNQSLSQTNVAGTFSSFTVVATGSRTLQYQWRKNGTNLTDGTNLTGTATATLAISNTQPADAANYDVVVTNNYGSVTSLVATLTVHGPPNIASNPQGLTNALGTTASFTVSATGDQPLTYQWQKDGADIAGGTSATYTIASVEAADAGNYDVVISNPYGTNVSQIAALDVTIPGLTWRTLHTSFAPGEVVTVELDITPPTGTTNWGLAEFYPSAWTVVSAPGASFTNDLTGELDYGPFTNADPQTFIYSVASIFELTNSAVFSGQVWFNGNTNAIGGYTTIPALKQWEFVGPQSLLAYDVSGAAHGAGRWVATAAGWTTTLADGGAHFTYPMGQFNFATDWSRMAFLGGKFIRWGKTAGFPEIGLLAASDDGLSWKSARPSPGGVLFSNPSTQGFSFLESAAYGNGVYVVVGMQGTNIPGQGGSQQGAIWVSTNAYEWNQSYQLNLYRTTDATRDLYSVAFANGKFIAVGDLGTVVVSTVVTNGTDGLGWTETQDPLGLGSANTLTNAGQSLEGIAYGPAGWLVIKSGIDNRGLCSTNDGASWSYFTGAGVPGGSGGISFNQCFYADGNYWFTTSVGLSYSTADGSSWTHLNLGCIRRASDGVSPLYLAGGGGGLVYGSDDGTNWAELTSPASGYWNNYGTVLPTGAGWMIAGFQCNGLSLNGFIAPINNLPGGFGWVPTLSQANSFADSNLNWSGGSTPVIGDYIVAGNRIIVAGAPGAISSAFAPNQLLVAGAIDPSKQTFQGNYLATNSQACPYQIYQGEKVSSVWGYLKASFAPTPSGFDLYAETASFGYYGNSSINWGHYFSADGTNWSPRSPGLNDINMFSGIRGIAWGAGNYVAVALGTAPGVNSTNDQIFTSTDGQHYTPLPLSAVTPALGTEGLTGVGFNAGAFVAIGSRGRILYSTDGMNWQSPYGSDGMGWNRLRYLNKTWWAVGVGGRVASSTNGTTWTVSSTGVTNSLNDIASVQGYYMVVGDNAMVLLSTFHAPLPPEILPGSVSYASGVFQFTVQTDPNVLPVIEASQDLVNWTTNLSLTHTATDGTGRVTFNDSASGSYARRFYRARLP